MNIGSGIQFLKKLGASMKQSDDAGLAAEMAYHLMLSLFPAIIFLIWIFSFLGTQFDLFDDVMPMLFGILPKDIIPLVRDTVIQIVETNSDTFAIVGLLGFLWAASNGAVALMKGICRAYEFDFNGASPLKERFLSISIILVISTSLVIALNLLLFGNFIISWLASMLNLSEWITTALNLFKLLMGLGGLMISSIFIYTMSLKQLKPRIKWQHTVPGAIAFVTLWLAMSFGFKYYVENFSNFNKVYGALGGVIVLMTWLYLSSLALLIGGEVNALLRKFKSPNTVTSTDTVMDKVTVNTYLLQ